MLFSFIFLELLHVELNRWEEPVIFVFKQEINCDLINPSSSSFSFLVNRCDYLQICFSFEEKDKENIWQHVCYRLPCWLFVKVKHLHRSKHNELHNINITWNVLQNTAYPQRHVTFISITSCILHGNTMTVKVRSLVACSVAVSQFRGCILRRTLPLLPSNASRVRPLRAVSAIVKWDSPACGAFPDCLTRCFYPYITISSTQAREIDDLRRASSPFSCFLSSFSGALSILAYVRPQRMAAVKSNIYSIWLYPTCKLNKQQQS